jgi:hypothetical protein
MKTIVYQFVAFYGFGAALIIEHARIQTALQNNMGQQQ